MPICNSLPIVKKVMQVAVLLWQDSPTLETDYRCQFITVFLYICVSGCAKSIMKNAYCKLIWTWGARLEIVGTLFKLFDYIRICIAKKEREHSCIFI
jgi:hypothetical protein